jgi:flagella basal body P-ring formation protein FlgA
MGRALALISLALAASAWAAAPKAPSLRAHLPGTVTVRESSLRLGSVCVLACPDEALLRQANDVPMGRAPLPGEKLVLDRRTILSRLASSGIPAGRVELSGASEVTVTRDEQVFPADRLLQAAREFLAKEHPGPAGCGWRLLRRPGDLVVPRGSQPLELRPTLHDDKAFGLLRVEIAALDGEQPVGSASADFKLSYPARRAVALADLLPGQTLDERNVRVEDVMADQSADPNWASPIGLVAACRIARGAAITPGMVGRVQGDVLVRRNQTVMMKIEGFAFVLSAPGVCLSDGRCGDVVRVRNADSGRVVAARVTPDGTVRPIFEEVTP